MSTNAMRPLSTTSSGSIARLGASLHVKGEISGTEDLHIDGSVEGEIQLGDHKLTVGASAKLTADVVAREVVVYGSVKGNLQGSGPHRNQEGWLGGRRLDHGAHHD